MPECLFMNLVIENTCSHLKATDFAPASNKEFLDIQAPIEFGFTLTRARDMTRTYSQINSCLKCI